MPVPIEKLKEAQRPLQERIIEVLRGDSSSAYSLTEIWQRVEGRTGEKDWISILYLDPLTYQTYARVLSELVADGTLTSAQVGGTDYYAVAPPRR